MKRFATDGWWVGSLSLLIVANAILVYWFLAQTFGWENGYLFGDVLYHWAFFTGMFVAPLAAALGILVSVNSARIGSRFRSAALAFLSGGALLTAYISWEAILSGGR